MVTHTTWREWGATIAALGWIGLALAACVAPAEPAPVQGAAEAADGPTLSLVAAGQTAAELAVDVVYAQGAGEPGPRMVELHLGLAGGLGYANSAAGDAAVAADKDVIVQPQPDGALRVIVMATANTHRLGSGALVRLWLARSGGDEAVTLLDRRPVFAPPEADEGVVLGPALVPGGAP